MANKFQAPRGTRDILPGESERWERLESSTRDVMSRYGYREVRTPIFETTELFVRSVGEATDIVEELYTFEDRKGRSLTLRPEGTAPLVRAYLEHSLGQVDPLTRLYYIGPMFRYERPQAGRYRQFWQIGAELLGPSAPAADVEMIDLFYWILRAAGLEEITVHVNSLGDATCRPVYRERLRDYFTAQSERLCGDCRERLKTCPLGFSTQVPCRSTALAGAPSVLDRSATPAAGAIQCGPGRRPHLGGSAAAVRGLDYYTRTVFGAYASQLGAQNAVGGGGRYDELVRDFGGPATPAIGFSIGMERLLLSTGPIESGQPARPDVCVVAREPSATWEVLKFARSLRNVSRYDAKDALRVMVDPGGRSGSAQLKWASKIGARYAVFVPPDPDGYPVRDLGAGKDEMKQESAESLRRWLLERAALSTSEGAPR